MASPSAEHLKRSRQVLGTVAARDLGPLVERLRAGPGTVWVIGNGGSQANASHMVLHLQERGLRAHDLLAETASITAVSNDTDYAKVAAATLRRLAGKGDSLIVITGSGDSPNVVLALVEARRLGMWTFGLLGFDGGQAIALCSYAVLVNSNDYGCIEDAHSAVIHAINAELGA